MQKVNTKLDKIIKDSYLGVLEIDQRQLKNWSCTTVRAWGENSVSLWPSCLISSQIDTFPAPLCPFIWWELKLYQIGSDRKLAALLPELGVMWFREWGTKREYRNLRLCWWKVVALVRNKENVLPCWQWFGVSSGPIEISQRNPRNERATKGLR